MILQFSWMILTQFEIEARTMFKEQEELSLQCFLLHD